MPGAPDLHEVGPHPFDSVKGKARGGQHRGTRKGAEGGGAQGAEGVARGEGHEFPDLASGKKRCGHPCPALAEDAGQALRREARQGVVKIDPAIWSRGTGDQAQG